MSSNIDSINIFKPYLSLKKTYKGGITKEELANSGKKIYKLSSNEKSTPFILSRRIKS